MFLVDSDYHIRKSYEYDAFGNIIKEHGQSRNRLTYAEQFYDTGLGQYYLRARYYNPRIARFIQEDPYRGDGLNLYVYCHNHPVGYYDPTGYMCGKFKEGERADLGKKLDYQFGKAGGNKHNIDRTAGLKAEMDKLGFDDTPKNRAYFEQYYNEILNDSSNLVGEPRSASYVENGITYYYTVTTRESFLMGKYGGAKVTTYGDGNRLLTIKIASGKQTRFH